MTIAAATRPDATTEGRERRRREGGRRGEEEMREERERRTGEEGEWFIEASNCAKIETLYRE